MQIAQAHTRMHAPTRTQTTERTNERTYRHRQTQHSHDRMVMYACALVQNQREVYIFDAISCNEFIDIQPSHFNCKQTHLHKTCCSPSKCRKLSYDRRVANWRKSNQKKLRFIINGLNYKMSRANRESIASTQKQIKITSTSRYFKYISKRV